MSANPGARGLWRRGPAGVRDGTLCFAGGTALYDPFSPNAPMPDAEEIPHEYSPWEKDSPLLVDAVAQVAAGGPWEERGFAEAWGLLTTEGDAEPLAEFRRAAGVFREVCERLAAGRAPEPPEGYLARVHPYPLSLAPNAPRRWAFAALIDAAWFQLACMVSGGYTLKVCPTVGCGKLFIGWQHKKYHAPGCGGKERMRKARGKGPNP